MVKFKPNMFINVSFVFVWQLTGMLEKVPSL